MFRMFEYWDQHLSGKPHFSQELQDLQEEARLLRTEAVEKQQDVVYKEKARMHLRGSKGQVVILGVRVIQSWRVEFRDFVLAFGDSTCQFVPVVRN